MKKPLSILISVIITLAGTIQLLLPATLTAAPSVQIIAGSGASGYSGDGGPATTAQLASPASVDTDAAGNIYVVDNPNRRIRQIDLSGTIRTIAGDGTSCSAVTDPALPVTGLCPAGGMAVAPDGSIYLSQNGGIVRVAPGGAIYHYAGKYYGTYGPYNDGPKYGVSISPTAIAYDPNSGNVYFTEQRAIRAVTPSGQITTIAGVVSPGSPGCNSPSSDVAPALGSCFFPRRLAVSNGKIYFTEQSSWNGPRARVIEGDTVRTIAGNSTRVDPVDGAQATAVGFGDMAGIAVDTTGNVYLSGLSRGQVWKVAADTGTITKVTEFPGGAGWLTTDTTGNLYVSLQYLNQIAKITGLTPPKPLPKVASITPGAPSQDDQMLTRSVTITPADTGVGASRYEYGWATTATATEPSTPLQSSTTTHGLLNYGDTTPDQDWYLMARGISATGETGPWSTPRLVHTPKAPSLIILGDSISSGHHNDYGDNGQTKCDDPSYGYAAEFSTKWRAQLPAAWRHPGDYTNLAHSGFSTGSVLRGGRNACQEDVIGIPLVDATDVLSARPNSWNRVVISAGINDTNWGDAVKDVIAIQAASDFARQYIPWIKKLPGVSFGTMKEAACRSILNSSWNGRTAKIQNNITDGASKIASELSTADPTVKNTWLGYYNMAGTGTNEGRTQPYFPSACSIPVDENMVIVHTAIRSGLSNNIHFLSLDTVMREDNSKTQPLFLIQAARNGNTGSNPAGWPHPNAQGAQAISGLLQP